MPNVLGPGDTMVVGSRHQPAHMGLKATGHRHPPNDHTDEGYIINWDKNSERKEQFYGDYVTKEPE